jgi:hypothetical protein
MENIENNPVSYERFQQAIEYANIKAENLFQAWEQRALIKTHPDNFKNEDYLI